MIRRKFYIFTFLVTFALSVFGQQETQFSQYMYTILPINPGYAGNSGICASLHYRQQWAGWRDVDDRDPSNIKEYKTSPRTAMFTINFPIKVLHGGLGLSVYQENIGHQSDVAVKLAYSYKINIGGGALGVGLSGDFTSRQIKKNEYYGGQSAGDETIEGLGDNDMYTDISFGAYYKMQDSWYAGISASQILSSFMNTGGDKLNQKGALHFYALGGATFAVPADPNWALLPSALIKSDFKKTQVDLTLVADYKNIIWFGASYRVYDAVAILVGARPFMNFSSAIRGLEIVGSYDMTTSKMLQKQKSSDGGRRSLGGYEFCIKYCFNIVTKPTIYGYKGTRLLGNKPTDYR